MGGHGNYRGWSVEGCVVGSLVGSCGANICARATSILYSRESSRDVLKVTKSLITLDGLATDYERWLIFRFR